MHGNVGIWRTLHDVIEVSQGPKVPHSNSGLAKDHYESERIRVTRNQNLENANSIVKPFSLVHLLRMQNKRS